MSWIEEKANVELARVREAREMGVYPFFRPFESGGLRTSVNGHHFVSFSSNDYLGLTTHPRVLAAAHKAIDRFACGLSSSRIQATTVEHVALEKRLAEYFGFESCLVTTTGYQAMVASIQALADKDTTLVLDNLSHACILDGTFLAAGTPGRQAEVRFFNHNSARSLERILKSRERKNALVLVEGIYSLDGDMGKLAEIVEVCDRNDAVLLVDDAHGSGTLGTHGRGGAGALEARRARAARGDGVLQGLRRHRRRDLRQRLGDRHDRSTWRGRSCLVPRCRCRSWLLWPRCWRCSRRRDRRS